MGLKLHHLVLLLMTSLFYKVTPLNNDKPEDGSIGPGCAKGWAYLQSPNLCYKYHGDQRLLIGAAKQKCAGYSSECSIAMPRTEAQNSKLNDIDQSGGLIGLKRKTGSTFEWLDGSPLSGYSNWNTGEPSSQAGYDYVLMQPGGKWATIIFNTRLQGRFYTCQCPAKGCAKGWTYLQSTNSCYKYHGDQRLLLGAARQKCVEYGSDCRIAMPKTDEQNRKIDELGPGMIALQRKNGGSFEWQDGTTLSGYSNWDTGEPSSQAGYDYVLMAPGGKWKTIIFNTGLSGRFYTCQCPYKG